jgi:hypothetical protein
MPEPAPQQPLLDELQVWKHNRAVYPGWLIAPEAVRERIWEKTRNWVHRLLRRRPSLSVEQELEILSELNWRLETALVPLGFGLVELVPVYSHVLGAVNPFPDDITDQPGATLTLAESTTRSRDWSAIRRQWLAVGFGLPAPSRRARPCGAFGGARATGQPRPCRPRRGRARAGGRERPRTFPGREAAGRSCRDPAREGNHGVAAVRPCRARPVDGSFFRPRRGVPLCGHRA